ncbi:MAG: elongation factor 1-beta [Thermoplasmata archaeon]|nr:MAG: elongation factor 1-beta [Thermoplasmata archaeon]
MWICGTIGDIMGEVGITIKIMPEDMEIDLEELKKKIEEVVPERIKIMKTEVTPVAFGLKALLFDMIMQDESPDELIEKISDVEGVGRAEIEKVGRLL